jgi:hypothetical protein
MGAKDRVEDLDEDGNRLDGKVLHCTVRDTVRARSLAELKALDDFLNLVQVG